MDQASKTLHEGSSSMEEEESPKRPVFMEDDYEHVLDEGEEDFNDFSAADLERIPELGYSDKQVQEEVSTMTPAERAKFEELKRHYQHQYRLQGLIILVREVIKEALDACYPGLPGAQSVAVLEDRDHLHRQLQDKGNVSTSTEDQVLTEVDLSKVKQEFKPDIDLSKLSLYPAKTIAETIDLTQDPDSNIYIKVEPNQTFHDVLTCKGESFDELFTSDKEAEVKEISIHSSDEDDPFNNEVAGKILRRMAKNKREAADLQEEAAGLLEDEVLPLEEAKEVFKSGVEGNQKGTKVSEWLFDNCLNVSQFHLILALGYRVKEEARAQRAVIADKVPKPLTFKKIAEIFEVKANMLMNNYNLAVDYHNRHPTRSDKRRPGTEGSPEEDSPPRGPKVPRTTLDPDDFFEKEGVKKEVPE